MGDDGCAECGGLDVVGASEGNCIGLKGFKHSSELFFDSLQAFEEPQRMSMGSCELAHEIGHGV